MRDYVIITDSACDINSETLESWGVKFKELTFRFAEDNKEYTNNEMPVKDFYDKMRAGGVAKTAAVNSESWISVFEQALKDGKDVLCLAFSSGLSTTYNSARIAAQQLCGIYKDSKIIVIDTLCASAGEGLVVRLAVDKKNNGASIEENASYINENLMRLCHWFTVDDLVYLKRGGRISSAAAFFGNMIGIKPVLHVDDAGHLVNVSKVRGRRSALIAMADKYTETAIDKESGIVYISHADCENDAKELAKILNNRHGVNVEIITSVGPVIGAHAGPGTLALFFIGNVR